MARYTLDIQTADGEVPVKGSRKVPNLERLSKLFKRLKSGSVSPGVNRVIVRNSAVQASGTATHASVQANDTITINGATLTAKSTTPGAGEWLIGASDTTSAANCAALINSTSTLNKLVVATSALGVMTVTALVPGLAGNCITLASSNGTRLEVSAARLANGDEDAVITIGA